jgi:hypothetical protein
MEAIKAQIKFVEVKPEVVANPADETISELNDLELALVGGGAIDFNF